MEPLSITQEAIGARIDQPDANALRDLAKRNDRSFSAEIRQAIRFYLAAQEEAEERAA
jgi:predicted transcriptional regulator